MNNNNYGQWNNFIRKDGDIILKKSNGLVIWSNKDRINFYANISVFRIGRLLNLHKLNYKKINFVQLKTSMWCNISNDLNK